MGSPQLTGSMETLVFLVHLVVSSFLTGMEEPVKRENFRQFFAQFRLDAAAGGGPAIESEEFMMFTNVIRTQDGATMVENANFEIPGFATGSYQVVASGGKVLWEQAAPDN